MAYATDADLLVYVAGASAVSAALRTLALDDAKEHIDDTLYRGQARRAHAMLAAHYLATTPGSGLTGSPIVTSAKAGEISATFAAPAAGSDADLDRTEYGRAFKAIRDSIPHSPEATTYYDE